MGVSFPQLASRMDDGIEAIRDRKKREMLERLSGKAKDDLTSTAPDEALEMDDASIGAAIRSYPLLVVDCWAAWCGPCRTMAPVIEQLAKKYKGKMVFGKLNVDHNSDTAARFQIMSIPAFLVFKQGKHVDTIIGAMPAQQLEQKLARYI
mgnify:CR=1 FL=1